MQKNSYIIDGHTHLYPEKIAEQVITSFTELHKMEPTKSIGKGTVADMLFRMKRDGIAYTVAANFAPHQSYLRVNETTLTVAEEHRTIIPLICVYPDTPIDTFKDYFRRGAKGVKMHTGIQGFEPYDNGLTEIYHYCSEHHIPITFHCGETSRVHLNEFAAISHIEPVLKQYPEIPFMLTHLAAGDPNDVFRIAEFYPNAYFDTSITVSGEHCIYRIHNNLWEHDDLTVDAFRKISCNRITFGSDYPFGNPISDFNRILNMPLTDAEKRLILGENLRKVYHLN